MSVLDFYMFHPVARCANVKSLLSVVVSVCMVFIVSCVVQLLSLLPSYLKTKQKNCTLCFTGSSNVWGRYRNPHATEERDDG
jgi:hypothetical protein